MITKDDVENYLNLKDKLSERAIEIANDIFDVERKYSLSDDIENLYQLYDFKFSKYSGVSIDVADVVVSDSTGDGCNTEERDFPVELLYDEDELRKYLFELKVELKTEYDRKQKKKDAARARAKEIKEAEELELYLKLMEKYGNANKRRF